MEMRRMAKELLIFNALRAKRAGSGGKKGALTHGRT